MMKGIIIYHTVFQAVCISSAKPWKRIIVTPKGWCWRRRSLKNSLVWRGTPCKCSWSGTALLPTCLLILNVCCHTAVHVVMILSSCSICSDMSIHYVEVDEEETQAIVEEAMDLRRRRQALSAREPKPDLVLVQPIRCFSWVFTLNLICWQVDAPPLLLV